MIRARLLAPAVALTLAMAPAGPALALSCVPHDVADVYTQAAEAEEAYIVVHGRLHFDGSRLPETDLSNQQAIPPETRIPARITGKALSRNGFDMAFDRRIMLNVQCFGPWCAGAVPDTECLAFLRKTASGYRLSVTPCGGFGFAKPSAAMLDTVIGCFRGAPCKADLRR